MAWEEWLNERQIKEIEEWLQGTTLTLRQIERLQRAVALAAKNVMPSLSHTRECIQTAKE